MRGNAHAIDRRGNCEGGGIPGQMRTKDLFDVTAAEQRRGTIGGGRIVDGTDVAGESDARMAGCQVLTVGPPISGLRPKTVL